MLSEIIGWKGGGHNINGDQCKKLAVTPVTTRDPGLGIPADAASSSLIRPRVLVELKNVRWKMLCDKQKQARMKKGPSS
jgi:hypothetical protein